MASRVSREEREFFGSCALAFGDVDIDKGGFIKGGMRSPPRDCGCCSSLRWFVPANTMGIVKRQIAQKNFFDQLNIKAGSAREVLGLDQFVE